MPGTPAAAAYGRSICQTTFSERTSPCTWSARLTGRKTYLSVTPARTVQASIATFTQTGIGTVRTRPCLPRRSDQEDWFRAEAMLKNALVARCEDRFASIRTWEYRKSMARETCP